MNNVSITSFTENIYTVYDFVTDFYIKNSLFFRFMNNLNKDKSTSINLNISK